MDKLVACGFAAVLASAVFCSAYADVSADAYIQDGLVAHWDAIENAGYGQHDNAATVWTDLKGFCNLDIVADAATWQDKAFLPPQVDYATAAIDTGSKISLSAYRSIDTCLTRKTISNAAAVLGQGSRTISWQKDGFVCHNTKWSCHATLVADTPYSIYAAYGANGSTSVITNYLDGVPVAEVEDTRQQLAVNSRFQIGRDVNAYWSSRAPVNAVRLYDRVLEPWEIQLNSNLDKVRYNDVDGTTLDWPEGYAFQDDDLCYQVTASVEVHSTVETPDNRVAFNDGEAASSLAVWKPHGTVCTLTPVPDANHEFFRWEGDADGLAVTPEGVLTLDNKVRNLVCVFIEKGATARTWTGAAADGDWATAENWDPAGVPAEKDILTLPAGMTAVLGTGEDTPRYMSVDCAGTLVLSNWTTRLCVSKDVRVRSGGVLTCADAILSGPETTESSYAEQTFSRVNVSCGSLTVDAGGTIDLRLKGWRGAPGTVSCPGNGPGAVASFGPGHGGHGGGDQWHNPGSGALMLVPLPCDDPAAPVQPGSSGASYCANGNKSRGSSGGGVLRVEATGTVTVNGTITADGQDSHGYGGAGWKSFGCGYAHGAAGGSLYITCRDLAGSGVISANGGGGDYYAHGTAPSFSAGGGCIAIYYDANVQQASAVRGMKITAAAGRYYTRAQYDDHWETLNPGAVGESGRANADLGTLRFTDEKLVDALLGNGLSGQIAGFSPYTYAGDLSFDYGHVRFADTGTVVTVTGDLTFGGTDSRLEIGGCEARRRTMQIDIYAGNEVNRLTVGGDLTLGGVSRLDVRAAETNGVDRFGAEVTVGGTMTVGSNCFVYAWSDVLNTGSPHFEVGNLNVATGGTFTATRRGGAGARTGSWHVYGKSTGGGSGIGGGHGGTGGRATASLGCVSDNAERPSLVGAGGGTISVYSCGGAGGGIIAVTATNGTIRVDGTVSADGESIAGYGSGGAGGTVLLDARQLLVGESGRITAKGGDVTPSSVAVGGGGGGRIALYVGQPWSEALPCSRTVRSEEPFAAETYPGEFLFLGLPPDVSGGIVAGGTTGNGTPGEEGTVRYCHVNEAPGLLLLLR